MALAAYMSMAFVTSAAEQASPVPSEAPALRFAQGRILVHPRAGLTDGQLDEILRPHGGRRVGVIEGINVHVVELPAHASEMALARLLARHPHLKHAELDVAYPPALAPNDPSYPSEWHLTRISSPAAWNTTTGAGSVIAVLDSGVDGSHPDLIAALVPGWNTYGNDNDTRDVYGHGTQVAGTAAAVGDNARGVAGVAFGARIMPVRVTDAAGYAYTSLIAQGLVWAADHGARVANLSFQGVTSSSTVVSAAQYFRGKSGVVVAAAGNTGAAASYPQTTAITSVSATNSADARTSWSSYGNFVNLAAPGSGIWTTTRGGGYASVSGTSFSSPIVAGVYALMMAVNPSLAPGALDRILTGTARDLGSAGWDQYYGWGRVEAAAAVAGARQTVTGDTQNPAAQITAPTGGRVAGLSTVNVAATDNFGVAWVELYAGGKLVATDTTAPYAFSWDTTRFADGLTGLQARAYDTSGNTAASASISVTVANDRTPPSVRISSPVDGTVVGTSVAIKATASDNTRVARVALSIAGKQVASVSGSALAYTWNTAGFVSGSRVPLTATASDPAGNKASATSYVTVR
jgi:thermitase